VNLKEGIINRRTIRTYTDQEIKRNDIIDILNHATYAPTHKTRQTWRFVLIDGRSKDKLLNDLDMILADVSPEEARIDYKKKVIASARAILVVFNEKSDDDPIYTLEEYGAASALIQNFQLLAFEKGIGVCWKSHLFLGKMATHIGIKENEMVTGALTLGYFDVIPNTKERISAESKLTIF